MCVCVDSACPVMQALKKQLFEKAKILKDVSKQVKAKITENKELDKKLRELQVSVAERAQIEKLAGKLVLMWPHSHLLVLTW